MDGSTYLNSIYLPIIITDYQSKYYHRENPQLTRKALNMLDIIEKASILTTLLSCGSKLGNFVSPDSQSTEKHLCSTFPICYLCAFPSAFFGISLVDFS